MKIKIILIKVNQIKQKILLKVLKFKNKKLKNSLYFDFVWIVLN